MRPVDREINRVSPWLEYHEPTDTYRNGYYTPKADAPPIPNRINFSAPILGAAGIEVVDNKWWEFWK